jgi:hypothetical protein
LSGKKDNEVCSRGVGLVKHYRAAGFCIGLLLAAPGAQADGIEPGLWRITTRQPMNGAPSPPQVATRCLTPEQARDPGETFSPQFGGVNTDCERRDYQASGERVSWRLQCRGQFEMDVAGEFIFETARHYTATITTKGSMAGQVVMNSTSALDGEHIGECR